MNILSNEQNIYPLSNKLYTINNQKLNIEFNNMPSVNWSLIKELIHNFKHNQLRGGLTEEYNYT